MRAEILHRCIAMCVNLKNIKIKLYYIPNWCIRNLKKLILNLKCYQFNTSYEHDQLCCIQHFLFTKPTLNYQINIMISQIDQLYV